MPRTKKQIQTKEPAAVPLRNEHIFSSPHLLNLRPPKFSNENLGGQALCPQAPRSFEEKAEALDKRVREMPNLLKTQVSTISQLWESETTSLLSASTKWGKTIQKRLLSIAGSDPARGVRPRNVAYVQLRHFAFMAILIILVTIPLQTFLLYKSINGFYTDIKLNWDDTIVQLNTLQDAVQTGKIQPISTALNSLLPGISKMRATLDRLGPLRIVLPSNFKLADAGVRIAEQGLISLTKLSTNIADLQAGQGQPGTLIRSINNELGTLNSYAHKLLGKRVQTDLIKPILAKLDIATDTASVLADLYASTDTRHLLLVFQNPRELRATGGFAGSFALLTVRDGQIINITAPEGGTYALQGQLPLNYISPQPLQLINPRLEFQDANWWPDFPHSAKKITEIFETAGGPTIDGVLAITAKVGEDILKLNGPIKTAEGTVNADNFIDTLQSAIARDRAQDRQAPKKVITALLPLMKDSFISTAKEHPKEFLSALVCLLNSKDIQIWARADSNQAALSRLGWTGALKNTTGDYLAVITSNVGGGKTDGVVKETISHDVHIQANQTAREILKIQRQHQGSPSNSFEAYRNVSFIRIYVPQQAQFVAALGNTPPPGYIFEKPAPELSPDPETRTAELTLITDAVSKTQIWQEDNKTVFGVWMITDPGETSEVTIQYDVPLNNNGQIIPYSITVDPQGGKTANFNEQITLDDSIKTLTGNANGIWDTNGWKFNGTLNKTLVNSGIFYRL